MRLPIILIALALTLGTLFGARWIYQDQALDRPLAEAVRAVNWVEDVKISQRGDTIVVKVKTADVPRLEDFVQDLWRAVDSVENDQKVELELGDNRSQSLQEVYYDFHFFLQEAVATGRYSELPSSLAEVATPDKVTRSRVYVASDYVYVQFHQGEDALYAVIPRQPQGSAQGDQAQSAPHSIIVSPWGS